MLDALVSRRVARALLALAIATALLNSTAASPLYALYQAKWHFGATILTALFAAYSVGTLASLLATGAVSDGFADRRIVIFPGLLAVCGGALVCAVAPDLGWLFAGRFVAGIGTGAVTGAANAALSELDFGTNDRRAAIVATVSFTAGCTLGPAISAAALSLGLWPLQLPFLSIAILAALISCGLLACPWPITSRSVAVAGDMSSAPGRPIARSFLLASGGLIISWTVGATFMALGPSVTFDLLKIHDRGLAGLVPGVFQFVAGVGQIVFGSLAVRRSLVFGALSLSVALAAITAAASAQAAVVYLFALVSLGVAYGICFVGSAGLVNLIAPSHRRASVVSAFYIVGYLGGNAIPVLVFGAVVDRWGLSEAMIGLTCCVSVVAIFVILEARRTTSGAPPCLAANAREIG